LFKVEILENQIKASKRLEFLMQEIADIQSASSLLQWDQETYMPSGSANFRARQIATLSGLAHEKFISGEISDLVNGLLELNLTDPLYKRSLLRIKQDLNRKEKLKRNFVENLSQTISIAYQYWERARQSNDFNVFSIHLNSLVQLKKEECDFIGFNEHPYDVLVDEYEPGMTKHKLDEVFCNLLPQLSQLLLRIQNAPNQPNNRFLNGQFDSKAQWDLGIKILGEIGFDFNRGRQDLSTHPFTITASPDDVRITTRVSETDIQEMLWSCLHEAGHAMYEQGLSAKAYGFPDSEAASLGIHESQSRLWENQIGRELPFWKAHYQAFQQTFPKEFTTVDIKDFHRAINQVEPGFIRTNADELTYHFHVFIRYKLECLLIEDKLKVKDLESAWNSMYQEFLGITPKNCLEGILQDVHWAHGSFGYFPTYSLGSLYAAQFYNAAVGHLPDLESQLENGNTAQLLQWLKNNIYEKGRLYNSEEICQMATGSGLDPNIFMNYLNKKYQSVYQF
jgi:carboxypeptidase Taq